MAVLSNPVIAPTLEAPSKEKTNGNSPTVQPPSQMKQKVEIPPPPWWHNIKVLPVYSLFLPEEEAPIRPYQFKWPNKAQVTPLNTASFPPPMTIDEQAPQPKEEDPPPMKEGGRPRVTEFPTFTTMIAIINFLCLRHGWAIVPMSLPAAGQNKHCPVIGWTKIFENLKHPSTYPLNQRRQKLIELRDICCLLYEETCIRAGTVLNIGMVAGALSDTIVIDVDDHVEYEISTEEEPEEPEKEPEEDPEERRKRELKKEYDEELKRDYEEEFEECEFVIEEENEKVETTEKQKVENEESKEVEIVTSDEEQKVEIEKDKKVETVPSGKVKTEEKKKLINGLSWWYQCMGGILAPTVNSATGGGFHLYFKYTPQLDALADTKCIQDEDGNIVGVDILSGGKKVVMLPPSVWTDKQGALVQYNWRHNRSLFDISIAPIPAGNLKMLRIFSKKVGYGAPREVRQKIRRPDIDDSEITGTFVAKLVNCIATWRAEDYEDWVCVGMALRHMEGKTGENMFLLWDNWSSNASNYDESMMQYKWNSFSQDGKYRIGTLCYYAKTDNPRRYKRARADTKTTPKIPKTQTLVPLPSLDLTAEDSIRLAYEKKDDVAVDLDDTISNEARFTCIRACMGIGKTKAWMRIVPQYERVVVVVFRISLARAFCNLLQSEGFELYSKIKGNQLLNLTYLKKSFPIIRYT
jgi:hypothetical protein